MKRADVLDVTLREGGYVVGLGFTAADTRRIARALEAAGVRYIEIGHAWGLNAAARGLGEAAETDDGYLAAAADTLEEARFGMFCLAGVTRPKDLRRAASYGMGFARVGANATAIESAAPLVSEARECGLFVACNLMKSYTLEPTTFADKVELVQRFGAHVVYLVDSAGGMLPSEVSRYCRAVADRSSLPFGFHGHDNLGLAVANSLVAVEAGASMVDGSLQGLGRSAGNAALELVVAALHRQGIATGINLIAALDAGEALALPLVRRRGIDPLDVAVGFAQFHSSFLDTVLEVASEYAVDPRLLIEEVCKADRVNAPRDAVMFAAEQLVCDSAAERDRSDLGMNAAPLRPSSASLAATPRAAVTTAPAGSVSAIGEKLDRFVKGRTFVLVGDSLGSLAPEADVLLARGAARTLLIGDGPGLAEPPNDPRLEWRLLDITEAEVADGRRRAAAMLSALPAEIVSWLDEVDPGRTAEVFNYNSRCTAGTIAGRRVSGSTRPEWTALDDKTDCDRVWEATGVRHVPSVVVAVEAPTLRRQSARLDRGAGTVWAGDARDGPNSGAHLTRWIRDRDDFSAAVPFFRAHCDRLRIMPFVEGVSCSVHGIVTNNGTGVLRPCETIMLRTPEFGHFRLAGVASSWDPDDEDREDMRAAARRVGHVLSARVGYRGTFTLDGVLGEDGFVPTELNPRVGRALRMMCQAIPDAALVVHANFLAKGRDTGLTVADIEETALEAVDGQRGLWASLPLPTAPAPAAVDLVFTRTGLARAHEGCERDAVFRCGPAQSYTPGSLSLKGEPGQVPIGPSVAPIVADAFSRAEDWLGIAAGSFRAPEQVR